MAYLYHDNYPSNEVDIPRYSAQLSVAVSVVNAVYAVGDIDKGSLVQHGLSRQRDTNWQ